MQSNTPLSPRKPNKFVLKVKTRPAGLSPDRPPAHPLPTADMGRSVSCSNYRTPLTARSPRRIRECREGFSVCASRNVCVFARKPTLPPARTRLDPFREEAINLINDEVFLQNNSPHRRRYRLHPKSSHGFRNTDATGVKRGMHTEAKSRTCFEPWEAGLEGMEMD
jgi:hypothetical protein